MLWINLFLYEQTDGTDVGKTGGGDVPAAGPLRFPAHFYGDLPPSIRKERMEGLAGVNAASIEQQTGVRIEVLRGGQLGICPNFSVFISKPLSFCIAGTGVIAEIELEGFSMSGVVPEGQLHIGTYFVTATENEPVPITACRKKP